MSTSSNSEGEWENVESLPSEKRADSKSTAVEIVLSSKSSKRGKKQNALEKALAAFNKDLRYSLHKTSLLCLLVQGLHTNSRCSDPLLQARLLSLVPHELHQNTTSEKLVKVLKWFVVRRKHLLAVIKDDGQNNGESVETEGLGGCVGAVEILVAVLRALGLCTRLVFALNPLPFRPSREKTEASPLGGQETASQSDAGKKNGSKDDEESAPVPGPMFFKLMEQLKQEARDERDSGMECCSSVPSEIERGRELGGSESQTCVVGGGNLRGGTTEEVAERWMGGGGTRGKFKGRVRGRSKRKSTGSGGGEVSKKRKILQTTPEDDDQCSTKNKGGRTTRSKGKGKQPAAGKKITPTTTTCETSPYFKQGKMDSVEAAEAAEGGESDSDEFLPTNIKFSKRLLFESSGSEAGDDNEVGKGRHRQEKKRKVVKGKMVKGRPQKTRNVTSRTLNLNEAKSQIGIYDECSSWVEVFLAEQKRYVCLHIPSSTVDQPKMCEKHCPHKISYIIAIDSSPCVVDVTARYTSDWCTAARRRRLSETWWEDTLWPYSPGREEREREEEDIMNILYSHPLPTSINDYKSHPLYVLRRHLLKFEAIYPVESNILGYCKGEPVFSRNCVFNLHTRETWLKEGRVVKKDEEPYKVVKARPKKGQSVLEMENSTVEVFGHWQTEVYVPPPVVNGVVPKNEYGNVELFQPSMLPAGASHIKIASIHKVSRKLGISYAPAMVGWDFHSGHCCPVIEGIVVAQENEEVLLEAWRQEEQIMIEKQMKKREARVLDRWKKLTRGVLIRERVLKTYSTT